MTEPEQIPGNLSEMLLEFAKPLFGALGAPSTVDELRHVVMLATLCWNLPIMEREDVADYETTRHEFEAVLSELPEPLPSILRDLLATRLTRFGAAPHFLVTEVRGETLDDATLHAEARGFEA
jgi:hypothetical protein